MSKFLSIILRIIPLAMGAFTLVFGLATLPYQADLLPARVLIALTAICIALYCTAATIIRQLIGKFTPFFKWFLPILGYCCAAADIVVGIVIFSVGHAAVDTVSGNVMMGVGMIAACVSTVAATSTRFVQISINYTHKIGEPNPQAWTPGQTRALVAVPTVMTVCGLAWGIVMLCLPSVPYQIAGHVLMGLSLVCLSLIWLVVVIAQQINNVFRTKNKWRFSRWVIANGIACIVWGIFTPLIDHNPKFITPGFVLIGLGLICISISSKVLLLTWVWHFQTDSAHYVVLLPIGTCLVCLFMSVVLFSVGVRDPSCVMAGYIMSGLGAVCFTLYSIVSILESGTEAA
ncbi:MAG: DUF2776 family protein [Aeriscardovia sp.]|nr:DUF2776 family protein [Aeriscardovia sp.]